MQRKKRDEKDLREAKVELVEAGAGEEVVVVATGRGEVPSRFKRAIQAGPVLLLLQARRWMAQKMVRSTRRWLYILNALDSAGSRANLTQRSYDVRDWEDNMKHDPWPKYQNHTKT